MIRSPRPVWSGFAALSLAACSSTSAEWAQQQANALHTGSSSEELLDALAPGALELVWSAPIQGAPSGVAFGDGFVCLVEKIDGGRFLSLRTSDGLQLNEVEPPYRPVGTPAIGAGQVFVPLGEPESSGLHVSHLWAVDDHPGGDTRWLKQLQISGWTPELCAANEQLYVVTDRGDLETRDDDGAPSWRAYLGPPTSEPYSGAPACRFNRLVVAYAGSLVALDVFRAATSGDEYTNRLLWRLDLGDPVEMSPPVLGTLSVDGDRTHVVVVVAGDTCWIVELEGALEGGVPNVVATIPDIQQPDVANGGALIANGELLVPDGSGLSAYSLGASGANLERRIELPSGLPILGPPVADSAHVYVRDAQNVYGIAPLFEELVWQAQLNGPASTNGSAMGIRDGRLIVPTEGFVHAFARP